MKNKKNDLIIATSMCAILSSISCAILWIIWFSVKLPFTIDGAWIIGDTGNRMWIDLALIPTILAMIAFIGIILKKKEQNSIIVLAAYLLSLGSLILSIISDAIILFPWRQICAGSPFLSFKNDFAVVGTGFLLAFGVLLFAIATFKSKGIEKIFSAFCLVLAGVLILGELLMITVGFLDELFVVKMINIVVPIVSVVLLFVLSQWLKKD